MGKGYNDYEAIIIYNIKNVCNGWIVLLSLAFRIYTSTYASFSALPSM